MEPETEIPQVECKSGIRNNIAIGEIISLIPEDATTPAEDKTNDTMISKGYVTQSSKKPTQDSCHKLWLPDKQPKLANLVLALKSSQKQPTRPEASTPLQELESQTKSSLKSRQQMLQERIHVTQAVLPHKVYKATKPKEDHGKPEKKITFKEASKMVIARQRSNLKVSDDVSEYLAKIKAEGVTDFASSMIKGTNELASTPSSTTADLVLGLRKKYETQLSSGPQSTKCGSIPLHKWREIVTKNKSFFTSMESGDEMEDRSWI